MMIGDLFPVDSCSTENVHDVKQVLVSIYARRWAGAVTDQKKMEAISMRSCGGGYIRMGVRPPELASATATKGGD